MAERLTPDNSITMRIRVPNELRAALRAAAAETGELVEDFIIARLWSSLTVPGASQIQSPQAGRAVG